jgi:FSR family fosmidomycin resistance protein-like MFS transporter
MHVEPDSHTPASDLMGGRSRLVRVGATIGCHSIVDFFSFVPIALMPLLASRLGLSEREQALLLSAGAISSGAVQPVAAWVGDWLDTRVLTTLGLAIAAVCIGSIGFARSFAELLVLIMLGTIGVGAFHPGGAASAGHLGGAKRSLVVAIFFLAGMFGGMLSNVFSPMLVETAAGEQADYGRGLRSLAWLIFPGLVAAAALTWAIHRVGHRHGDAHQTHASLSLVERRGRWYAVWLLYVGNVIRFSTDMSLMFLFNLWSQRVTATDAGVGRLTEVLAADASTLNGWLLASKQGGMGAFGLLAGAMLPLHRAKLALIVVPLTGSIAIGLFPAATAALPGAQVWIGLAFALGAGVGFGSMIPVTIAMAQRLLPHRTSLASGMMMGGAWVFAAIAPVATERIIGLDNVGIDGAFIVLGVFLGLSSVLAVLLPGKLIHALPAH